MNTPESVLPRDMLDIIFANRNRAYGAYPMRRNLGWGLLLIGFFIMPDLITAQEVVPPTTTDTKAEIDGKTRDSDANEPLVLEETTTRCYGGTPLSIKSNIYELYDLQKLPAFPGGEQELRKYLTENTQYPRLARENKIQGNVALTFVIDEVGQISDVTILRDIGGGCSKEAVRIVNSMPCWSPGEANGNPVKVRFTLPVRFKLE